MNKWAPPLRYAPRLVGVCTGLFWLWEICLPSCNARALTANAKPCKIEATTFDGWKAEQITNQWVTVTIVPQLGGRVMQVTLGGHPYLFVNSRFKGQYFPPSEASAKGRWINYGGDKIWPLPEGTQDEQHWPGPISDNLDDGEYAFKIVSQGAQCTAELAGPPDDRTGLQYSRQISLTSDSPEISFRSVMKNTSAHPIQWSMQTVSQYDTADAKNAASYNHDFWAFTPINEHSAYAGYYQVRSGLSNDPSFSVKDSVFTLHWIDLQSEVWIDSPGDWVAVVDGAAQYAMIERFSYQKGAEYPGDASVIFYKNGVPPERKKAANSQSTPVDPDEVLLYMEAELNSPLVRLAPGSIYTMETNWFPVRATRNFKTVTDAGIVCEPLQAVAKQTGVQLSGSFGVFFSGKLTAQVYDSAGLLTVSLPIQDVSPADLITLEKEVAVPPNSSWLSLHLIDRQGEDRGSLGEVHFRREDGSA
jgi:hypothetical protein